MTARHHILRNPVWRPISVLSARHQNRNNSANSRSQAVTQKNEKVEVASKKNTALKSVPTKKSDGSPTKAAGSTDKNIPAESKDEEEDAVSESEQGASGGDTCKLGYKFNCVIAIAETGCDTGYFGKSNVAACFGITCPAVINSTVS